MFRRPPPVRLGTAAEWSHLSLNSDDELFAAQGEIKDYFYARGLPSELSPNFSLPALKGDVLIDLCVFRING